ncbi:NAD(P)-dependent alcohol dehydrogenase [Leucobacter denitrificans]|uniref:NAD(P)-dependent alcohol dehydrogenase n=1 Tax=Leucobacter denitrificans TaxID=683042 RepID=A0A7G9S362_9MICO|nr:NAD(P)-dependent alcohol dehydrogenase [Leucobacter denitrificans]QNN62287.1 NAD(P)-dependent alcohol dehydrogenase [Leucobacter denitrificans]
MNASELPVAAPTYFAESTMQAWVQHRYGGAEEVALKTIAVPKPKSDEVIVRARATGLNAADARLMRGTPALLRLGFGITRPKQPVRGIDIAGTIVALGSKASESSSGFNVGDEVVAETPGGGLALFVAVPVRRLVHRPEAVSVDHAAALPIAGGTAVQALELARVGSGSRVLVIGASGGVGTYAVQLARIVGAEVSALCGERSRVLVEELGAIRTHDYRQTSLAELPQSSFDAIIDIAGTAPLPELRGLLAPGGTLVMVAGEGGSVLGPIPRILRAVTMRKPEGRRIRPLAAVAKPEILERLLAFAAEGQLRPVIEHTYSFTEGRDALTRIDSGRTVGKLVVRGLPL